MIHVKYISFADDASSWYRSQGVFPYIKHEDLKFTDISSTKIESWVNCLNANILVIQRPSTEFHLMIIKQAQQFFMKVIVDFDDDILNIPEHNPAYGIYHPQIKFIKQIIRIADEVWVSTKSISESFAPFNRNIHIIPNAHNNFVLKDKKPFNPENKMVVYRGGHTHRFDLYSYREQLVKTAKENHDWAFMYIGADYNEEFFRANQEADNKNVSVTNGIPFIQYIAHLRFLNAMVAICPLENTVLNRGKSNICFIEAVYAGSAFFANKKLPEFNLDCILPMSALGDTLHGNLTTRLKKCNEEAWQYIKKNLFLSEINKLRIERLLK